MKFNNLAPAAALLALNSCMVNKPSVGYQEGVVTVAADNNDVQKKIRETTKKSLLGMATEGKQNDDSYILCGDMSSVFFNEDVTQEDLDRIAGKFQLILLDQAEHLARTNECGNYLAVQHWEYQHDDNPVHALAIRKTKHEGKFICIWTTKPQQGLCHSYQVSKQ